MRPGWRRQDLWGLLAFRRALALPLLALRAVAPQQLRLVPVVDGTAAGTWVVPIVLARQGVVRPVVAGASMVVVQPVVVVDLMPVVLPQAVATAANSLTAS